MRAVLFIVKVLFALCLPLFLITSNLRWAINSHQLYEYGFDSQQVATVTGLPESELMKVTLSLIDYFNFKRDTAQVVIMKGGEEFKLFTERELVHLRDVRGLVQLDYFVQLLTLSLIVVFGVILVMCRKEARWRRLTRGLLWGSALTLGLIIMLALWSLLNFDQLFLLFHLIGFPNDYWLLDPSQHYLIRLFPQGFFYQAALFIAGATLVEALIVGSIAFGVRKSQCLRARKCYSS